MASLRGFIRVNPSAPVCALGHLPLHRGGFGVHQLLTPNSPLLVQRNNGIENAAYIRTVHAARGRKDSASAV